MAEAAPALMLAQDVLKAEATALREYAERLDGSFSDAVHLLADCTGRIIVSGMGKSGHVARKIASTLSSTGTPALFLHPAESAHGDMGVLTSGDAVILLSKSGETREILYMLPRIKRLGVRVLCITNTKNSTLAREADCVLTLGLENEACPFNLAPTTSTTVMMGLGDALAIVLMRRRSFAREDFMRNHPAGNLGSAFLLVKDLMQSDDLPYIGEDATVREALLAILSHKNRGIAIVLDREGRLSGVLCDGDLKRLLLKHENLLDMTASAVMTRTPESIRPDALAHEALARMEGRITSLVVLDEEKRPLGLLHIHDILEARVV